MPKTAQLAEERIAARGLQNVKADKGRAKGRVVLESGYGRLANRYQAEKPDPR